MLLKMVLLNRFRVFRNWFCRNVLRQHQWVLWGNSRIRVDVIPADQFVARREAVAAVLRSAQGQ